jgi:hypothetical protein
MTTSGFWDQMIAAKTFNIPDLGFERPTCVGQAARVCGLSEERLSQDHRTYELNGTMTPQLSGLSFIFVFMAEFSHSRGVTYLQAMELSPQ